MLDTSTLTLNLKNESARNTIQDLSKSDLKNFLKRCKIEDFLQSLQSSALKLNDYQVFPGLDTALFVKGKIVHSYGESVLNIAGSNFPDVKRYLENETPNGVILTSVDEKASKSQPLRAMILMNGDEYSWDNENAPSESLVDNEELKEFKFPVCSFQCLSQFYKKSMKVTLKKLVDGELFLLDYTSEETINLTKEEKKKIKQGDSSKLSPPILGFSLLMNEKWHRSGLVLFHDKKEMQCILMGQDEGTYFGVQLPEIVSTVFEALDILIPSEVRGKKFARQGEWFIVKVEDKDLPGIKDRVCNFFNTTGEVSLPIEDEDSNHHYIHSDEGFVGRDGRIFAKNPTLSHSEHDDVELIVDPDTYCTFYKNTAVRSFSQEGVD